MSPIRPRDRDTRMLAVSSILRLQELTASQTEDVEGVSRRENNSVWARRVGGIIKKTLKKRCRKRE